MQGYLAVEVLHGGLDNIFMDASTCTSMNASTKLALHTLTVHYSDTLLQLQGGREANDACVRCTMLFCSSCFLCLPDCTICSWSHRERAVFFEV